MRPLRLLRKALPVSSRTVFRFRELCAGSLTRSALARLVRRLSGDQTPAGREIPSRREAWGGFVLYALLVPFGLWALRDGSLVTGTLLTAIGCTGCAGIALRNMTGPGSPPGGRNEGGPQ